MELRSATTFVVDRLKSELKVAEIGVREGEHALGMLKVLNIKKLYLIDHYLPYQDGNSYKSPREQDGCYLKMFKNLEPFFDKIVLITRSSEQANNLFLDEFFDFIYIDACHDYEMVKKDINIWYPKVKKDGYLGGHDYSLSWEGVKIAVDEFEKEKSMKIISFGDSDWILKK